MIEKQDEKLLGRYSLGDVIGVGGMGSVVEAHDSVLERRVAIKFLKEEYARDTSVVERFRREARIAASLSHPGIAQVFDFQESDGRKFIVMELLQGRDLHTHLVKKGPLEPEEAGRIIYEAATALGHAHDEGAVHRDIKPGNIFLTNTGAVKVTDFGIAVAKSQLPVTVTGELLGTALYLSPEQINGAKATPASDVYALGCVFYQALSGSPPYEAETQIAIAKAHTNDPIPSIRDVDSSIPEEVDQVIQRAMAKSAADRYSSASEMAAALRDVIGNIDTQPGSSGPATEVISGPRTEVQPATPAYGIPLPDPRRFRLSRPVVAVLLLAAVLVALVMLARFCTASAQELPDLREMPFEAAKQQAIALGIPEAKIVAAPGGLTDKDAGVVLAQDPRPGTEVGPDTRLILTVSEGKGIQVPNVMGFSKGDAERVLKDSGLQVETTSAPAPDDQKDKVIDFQPQGLVPPGTTVTLTIGEEQDKDEGRRGKGKEGDDD